MIPQIVLKKLYDSEQINKKIKNHIFPIDIVG